MAMRIGGLPLLFGPADLVAGVRATLKWTDDTVELVANLPGRADRLLSELEVLLTQVRVTVDRVATIVETVATVTAGADRVVGQAATVSVAAQEVVERSSAVAERADAVINDTAATLGEAAGLLAVYQPILTKAGPLAAEFVDQFSAAELQAAIRLVDTLPTLTERVENDVLPMLATLDRVGPDIQELLEVAKDVRNAIASLPGFKLLRRSSDPDE